MEERESKLGSAIEEFLTACEEKAPEIKEADFPMKGKGFLNPFLLVASLCALGGGAAGLVNGYHSHEGDLARIKAMREARKRQLALQEEFEPAARPDIEFLPAPRREGQRQLTFAG